MIRNLMFYIDKDDSIGGTNWTSGKLTRTVQYQQQKEFQCQNEKTASAMPELSSRFRNSLLNGSLREVMKQFIF